MATNVLVVGGGKVGTSLVGLLLSNGLRVKIIEKEPEKVLKLKRDLPLDIIIEGSGTDPGVLESAGIRSADVLAAVTGDDEMNLVATSLARFEFKVPRTIARVNNPRNAWMFTAVMGVDVALNQAEMMAHLVSEEMSLGDMMTLLKLRKGKYSLVEERVHTSSRAVGKSVHELDLPAECVLTAIIRKGQLLIPRPDLRLQPADEVLALVHESEMGQLAALLGNP